MTTTTKGADGHKEEGPSKGGKYVRGAKARRRDRHLMRRYIAQPPRLRMATQRSCSWQR
jgi:hypothetical protein